jgi:hypothetical protein
MEWISVCLGALAAGGVFGLVSFLRKRFGSEQSNSKESKAFKKITDTAMVMADSIAEEREEQVEDAVSSSTPNIDLAKMFESRKKRK